METTKYRCSQPELYSAGRMVIRAAVRELTAFTNLKPKYTAPFFAALENDVANAELVPDVDQRHATVTFLRLKTEQAATECLRKWQFLKGYIEDAKAFEGEYLKPALQAAGQTHYEAASGMDWESVQTLMVNGKQFIANNTVQLTANDNMPPAFALDFDGVITDFGDKLKAFQDEEENGRVVAENKIQLNNDLYESIIKVCKDGQRIFRDSEALREQFIWDSVLYLVRGAGVAGIRGVVKNELAETPIVGATILVLQTGDTGLTDEEGNYRITGVPAGNYTVRCTATGFAPFEKPFEVLTGTVSALNFKLTPL